MVSTADDPVCTPTNVSEGRTTGPRAFFTVSTYLRKGYHDHDVPHAITDLLKTYTNKGKVLGIR